MVTPYQGTEDFKYSRRSHGEHQPSPEEPFNQTTTILNAVSSSSEFESQDEISAQVSRHERSGRTRTGARVLQCPCCGREFTHNRHLENHMRTHTGEKPFECNVCGVGFSQTASLKRHLRAHTGEKPYKCEICKTGFADACNLAMHLRTHTGEKPYKCPLCGRGFSRKSNLKLHLLTPNLHNRE